MRACLEVDPLRVWYYRISLIVTMVILLQVDPTSGYEPETVCEGYYKIRDISIFAWSSIPSIGYYRWVRDLIYQLPPNSKVDYLVRTIRRILDFLQL